MIEIKLKKSSKNGSIKKNSKIQIKKLVRTNTIHAFDAVCGHTKSFYTDSDGIILKKNSRAGMVFITILKNIFSVDSLKCSYNFHVLSKAFYVKLKVHIF